MARLKKQQKSVVGLLLTVLLSLILPISASFAGGFAKTLSSASQDTFQLSKQAKKLLKKHGNDIDAASREYFQSLFDGGAVEHDKRVAATWDTVALFLPMDYSRTKGKVEAYVDRRLKLIATVSTAGANILDVGCGDGAVISYLPRGFRYRGIDVSSNMIELGKKRHAGSDLRVGSFPACLGEEEMFDTILFNGSLQFFSDTQKILESACQHLTQNGRLVLTHVNGAKFVRSECRSNPHIAVRHMPVRESLQQVLGMKLLSNSELLPGFNSQLDGDDDDFYLVVLEKI